MRKPGWNFPPQSWQEVPEVWSSPSVPQVLCSQKVPSFPWIQLLLWFPKMLKSLLNTFSAPALWNSSMEKPMEITKMTKSSISISKFHPMGWKKATSARSLWELLWKRFLAQCGDWRKQAGRGLGSLGWAESVPKIQEKTLLGSLGLEIPLSKVIQMFIQEDNKGQIKDACVLFYGLFFMDYFCWNIFF